MKLTPLVHIALSAAAGFGSPLAAQDLILTNHSSRSAWLFEAEPAGRSEAKEAKESKEGVQATDAAGGAVDVLTSTGEGVPAGWTRETSKGTWIPPTCLARIAVPAGGRRTFEVFETPTPAPGEQPAFWIIAQRGAAVGAGASSGRDVAVEVKGGSASSRLVARKMKDSTGVLIDEPIQPAPLDEDVDPEAGFDMNK